MSLQISQRDSETKTDKQQFRLTLARPSTNSWCAPLVQIYVLHEFYIFYKFYCFAGLLAKRRWKKRFSRLFEYGSYSAYPQRFPRFQLRVAFRMDLSVSRRLIRSLKCAAGFHHVEINVRSGKTNYLLVNTSEFLV